MTRHGYAVSPRCVVIAATVASSALVCLQILSLPVFQVLSRCALSNLRFLASLRYLSLPVRYTSAIITPASLKQTTRPFDDDRNFNAGQIGQQSGFRAP